MLKGKLTLSTNRNPDDGLVHLELKDDLSKITFVALHITRDLLMRALGGLAYVDCEFQAKELDKVGKTLETRTLECPVVQAPGFMEERKGPKERALEIVTQACPDEWKPDLYFGSQDSFFTKDGRQWCRTTVRRWVEPTKEALEGEAKP